MPDSRVARRALAPSIARRKHAQASGRSASASSTRAAGGAGGVAEAAIAAAHSPCSSTAVTSSRPTPRPLPRTVSSTASAIQARAAVACPTNAITAVASPYALAEDHDLSGFEEDDEVEEEGVVLDVIEVVLEFFEAVLDGRAVGVADLGPSGDAGFQ